jgi:hypothetical protein
MADKEEIPTTNMSSNMPLNNQDGVNVYNQVQSTVSGHQFEVDDTVGNERICRRHAKGTKEEWDANGDRKLEVRGRDYVVIIGDEEIEVRGRCNITVNGDCSVNADGNLTAKAKQIDLTSESSINIKAGTSINMEAVSGDFAVNSGGGYRLDVAKEATERFRSSLDTNIDVNNDLNVGADSKVMVTGNSTQITEGGTNIFTAEGMVIGSGTYMALSGGTSLDFASTGSTIFNGADLTIESGKVTIVDELETDSTITSIGVIHSNDDVTAGSIRLKSHVHGSSPGPS